MTLKQRPRPSWSSDRPLPITTNLAAGEKPVMQQADRASQAGLAQCQIQGARLHAQLREGAQHLSQAHSTSDPEGVTPITPIYAADAPVMASAARPCCRLPVERTYEDVQTLPTAREAE